MRVIYSYEELERAAREIDPEAFARDDAEAKSAARAKVPRVVKALFGDGVALEPSDS